MKLTKYPQSCLFVETKDKKILIDPGVLSYKQEYQNEWDKADLILITHKHGDHCNAEFLKDFKKPIYSTQEVASTYPKLNIKIIKETDALSFENTKVEVVKAVHGYLPLLTNNNAEIQENVGYIIDDEKESLYVTGDTISFKNGYKCDIYFAPVSGHGLVMSPFEVAMQAKENGGVVIPCHMDNPKFPVDLEEVIKVFVEENIRYKIL